MQSNKKINLIFQKHIVLHESKNFHKFSIQVHLSKDKRRDQELQSQASDLLQLTFYTGKKKCHTFCLSPGVFPKTNTGTKCDWHCTVKSLLCVLQVCVLPMACTRKCQGNTGLMSHSSASKSQAPPTSSVASSLLFNLLLFNVLIHSLIILGWLCLCHRSDDWA